MSKFHIHIDAHELNPNFEQFLLETLEFNNTDFAGHPEDVLHFETPRHLTYKTEDPHQSKLVFDQIIKYLNQYPESIIGYVEGEYIPLDIDIQEQPFDASVPIPCQFSLTSLEMGTFREDEIHITLDYEKSHPQLITNLRKMGFFSAYMDKPGSRVEILTAQGSLQQIQNLLPQLLTYLKTAGGAVKCSVKEERIIRWWVSSSTLQLPYVIEFVRSLIC